MPYPVDILAIWTSIILVIGIIFVIFNPKYSPFNRVIVIMIGLIATVSISFCIYDFAKGPTHKKEYHTYWNDVIVSVLRGSPTHRRLTKDQEVGCEVVETSTYKYIRLLRYRTSTKIDGIPCSVIRTKDNNREVKNE